MDLMDHGSKMQDVKSEWKDAEGGGERKGSSVINTLQQLP